MNFSKRSLLETVQSQWILSPLFFIGVIILWEYAVKILEVPFYIIPPPSQILVSLTKGLSLGSPKIGIYYEHLAYTLGETLLGFAVGIILGIGLGILIAQFPLFEKTIFPMVVALQSMPKVALAPLLMIWFGAGIESKIFMAGILCFFPLLVNAIAGFATVEPDRIDLMRSLGANNWQIFKKVKLPSSLPFIFAGLELGIVYSLLGAIVGELVGGMKGIGVLIIQRQYIMDVSSMFALLVILSAVGVLLNAIVKGVEKKVVFWTHREEKETIRR